MNQHPTLINAYYTLREEIANSVTHGFGIVLAIAALATMATVAARNGDLWHVASCSIFGSTLVLLYTASTLYHSIQAERFRPLLRALDHSAIFLLIAGTYTPFTLVTLRGPWGWSLFAVVWGFGITGIILRLLLRERLHWLFVSLYLAMGWVVVIAIQPLLERLEAGGLVLLAAGGIAYTGGIAFYVWDRLPYNHAIWHGFCLLGSALHVCAVLFYVIP
ncbi:MAG: hemolysin III family protein [Betaproteobacteria bacterium]|nr:hemolysin III family protein [Betaproteobacteria bacterium]